MAAFALIVYSISVDLYQVGLRCLDSGFSISSIINALKDIHEEVRVRKYLECLDEIYENCEIHSIGVECRNCRQNMCTEMICDEIETALEVDGCEEAFEILSKVS